MSLINNNTKNNESNLVSKPAKNVVHIARNWYEDSFEKMQIQRNIFIAMAIVFSIVICSLMLGIWYYTSKTTIDPFVIEIEPKTGVTTVVYPLDSKALSDDEAIRRYFVWKYVKLREEYFTSTFDLSFGQVYLYSTPDEYNTFNRQNNKDNKQSPYYAFGVNGVRQAKLKSLTFLANNVAQVRFKSETSGVTQEAMDKIATLTFEFSNIGLNEVQRVDNPLGFKVSNYRVEDELVK